MKRNTTVNSSAQLDELKLLFSRRIGLRVPPDAQDRFAALLHERAARLGYASLEKYRTFLSGDEADGEWEVFVRAFTSIETFFFRDHGQFDLLRLRLLPELIARHQNDKTLRLWSAGCSSGEEAYSLAMLVDMLLPERNEWNVFILGTDIDSMAITKAQSGCYGKWSFRMFPAAIQQRYFINQESGIRNAEIPASHSAISNQQSYRLEERIRNMVTFRVGNLVGDPFPDSKSSLHDMDLILCRNVFIYFDSVAVPAVAAKFAATLAKEGYLMTAHTELIGHTIKGLESKLFAEGVVYQRQARRPAIDLSRIPDTVAQTPLPNSLHKPTGHSIKLSKTDNPISARIQQTGSGIDSFGQVDATSLEDGGTGQPQHAPSQPRSIAIELNASARKHADRGEYELAENKCREALAADPLAAAPYFLMAQLAEIKGDLNEARECLNKTIYLDHRCVAGYLELAALYERDGNMPHAQTLRRTALKIVRSMPSGEQIEQYKRTAGELAQWLAQFNAEFENGE